MVSAISSPQVSPYAQTLAPAGGAATDGTNAPGATFVAANAHREASGDLSIVTKEGDTVTISANLEADATFASIRTRGASASYLSLETSSSFEISVQGELSEQEMQDVQKLVKQFSRELRQFFRGSEGADATDVGKGEFSSLTGFAVKFDASASVTVIAAVAQPAGALPGDSPGNPAPVEDEGGATVPAGQTAPVTTPPVAIDSSALTELAGKLLHLSRKSGLDAEKLGRMVGRMFDHAAKPFEGGDRSHVLDNLRRQVERGAREGARD